VELSLTGSKRRTVNAEIAGSSPVVPPSYILDFRFWILDWRTDLHTSARTIQNPKSKIQNRLGAVAERRMHFPVEEDHDGSSPFGPAISILDFGFRILDLKSQSKRPHPQFSITRRTKLCLRSRVLWIARSESSAFPSSLKVHVAVDQSTFRHLRTERKRQ
jgi:hypothetical protein